MNCLARGNDFAGESSDGAQVEDCEGTASDGGPFLLCDEENVRPLFEFSTLDDKRPLRHILACLLW